MRALAAVQRLELSLGAFADSLYSLTQVSSIITPYFQLLPECSLPYQISKLLSLYACKI